MTRSASTLMEYVVLPLQERVEEWRRSHHTLDKDHTKGKNRPAFWAECRFEAKIQCDENEELATYSLKII